jgi:ribosomal protein S6--L-glutamate ligase
MVGAVVPKRKVIALEHRLIGCRNVSTFGVKTNFSDYSPAEQLDIRQAEKIYYPSRYYADLFGAMGKKTFPSHHTYRFVQDKIKQSAMFALADIPHPRTRVYYGKRQKNKIGAHFKFPFIAKVPRGSALGRGVFLIHDKNDLDRYLEGPHPAYIQEYQPIDRDIRVVVIGARIVHAYWRINPANGFRSNVALGGQISLESVPEPAMALALHAARTCGWDDVGMDICAGGGRYMVLEANMKYGKEGFRAAGIDYTELMEQMIENGDI